ncbi:MAG: restriction endonuclease [Flavobacteriales bacterium]
MNPVLHVLRNNGGVGSASEIIDAVIEHLHIPDAEVEQTIPSGQSRVRNQIQWARYYLAKAGLVDSPKSGVWRMTQEGQQTNLSDDQAYALFQRVLKEYQGSKKKTSNIKNEDNALVEDEEHTESLLDTLKGLTPAGFERICKRLLTEIGIHDIQITGGAGDQGIDGIGRIRLNDVVNFNIVFQCKRYKETVSPALVRDFRGSMQGRAEKGLILTTGRFTQEAQKEANRDGVPPIELIDGERLVSLFEKYELGLKPKTVYELVPEFFRSFES